MELILDTFEKTFSDLEKQNTGSMANMSNISQRPSLCSKIFLLIFIFDLNYNNNEKFLI